MAGLHPCRFIGLLVGADHTSAGRRGASYLSIPAELGGISESQCVRLSQHPPRMHRQHAGQHFELVYFPPRCVGD
eukprot:scaffold242470_cov17-Prasinocladus_malaysianus.AAC.1